MKPINVQLSYGSLVEVATWGQRLSRHPKTRQRRQLQRAATPTGKDFEKGRPNGQPNLPTRNHHRIGAINEHSGRKQEYQG